MRYILDIKKCKFIGKGHEGTVYLTPEGFALKIFHKNKSASNEVAILEKVSNSRFFPKVLFLANNMVLREYVDGENLKSHLKKHGLSYCLAVEITDLIEEFKLLHFSRLNIRNAHIFVTKDEKIKIIDPRKTYTKDTPYPKDIIKILNSLNLYDQYLQHLSSYRPDLLIYWSEAYDYFIKMCKKSYLINFSLCN